MNDIYRPGVIVRPYERLTMEEIRRIDRASMAILEDPGFWCFNERAAKHFASHGAAVAEEKQTGTPCWRIKLPSGLVREAVSHAPSSIVMGARHPENRLLLDAEVPRVYFGSGSEANIWLETRMDQYISADDPDISRELPVYTPERGTTDRLCRAARLCDQLEHLDFFIRPLNIQDPDITEANHDVNKFFASLNNITKHVQAGLTRLESLPDVIKIARIIAGGAEELRRNPVLSFITCVFKSPLQMVEDTADKVFALAETGLPLVISSSPQGGSSAPIQEAGMVAQINAEILAGVTLTQLIQPGMPVLYGSVPVRARLDDLHDLYGCAEFNQYNIDCVQMARHYRLPAYSTAGVGDAKVPGMQAMFEKLFTHLYMAMSGAQYIHYAFGLLDRTNIFCPLQAVLDNEQIGHVKHCVRSPRVDEDEINDVLGMVRKVMNTSHRLFARHARKALHRGDISEPYRFETKAEADQVIRHAVDHLAELESRPARHLEPVVMDRIFETVPGILPSLRQAAHP